jgi:DNA topoisomerase-2
MSIKLNISTEIKDVRALPTTQLVLNQPLTGNSLNNDIKVSVPLVSPLINTPLAPDIKQPSSTPQITRISPQPTTTLGSAGSTVKLNIDHKENVYAITKIDGGLTQADFTQLSDREHVLQRPNMYLSSSTPELRETLIFDLSQQGSIKMGKVTVPQAMEQAFAETITNCSDNVCRSYRAGVDPGDILIRVDPHTIYLKNGGIPIPVEMHEAQKVMVPEMIFGRLRAGSNLGANRFEAGMNGIGIKAVNIFSKFFRVIIHDAIRKKRYQQDWHRNMSVCDPPLITEYKGNFSSVEVVYTLDIERFGCQEYPVEFFNIIARHCANVSFTTKIKIGFNYTNTSGAVLRSLQQQSTEFNTVVMDYGLLKNYGALYHGEKAYNNSIMYYEWPPGTTVVKRRDGQQYASDKSVMPIVEMLVVDTPNESVIASFVNSMYVCDGGCHVDLAVKAVSAPIIDLVNSRGSVKTIKATGKKSAKAVKVIKKTPEKKEEKPLVKITMRDVHNHLSFIISVRVANPEFDSQSKNKLKGPKIKYLITEDELQPVLKWDFVQQLYQILNAKNNRIIAASDARNLSNSILDKGFHANKSRSDPMRCTLFICEGDGALGYIRVLVDELGGRDYFGGIPLKGKIKNVMGESEMDLISNEELKRIGSAIGITAREDYTKPENLAKRKYGRIVFVTDADVDGKHIAGLGFNNFFCRYPGLLESGCIYYLRTPYMRVRRVTGNIKHTFYTQSQYQQWAKITPDAGNPKIWKAKYFKGLGTSKREDIKEDCQNLWLINIQCVRTEDKNAIELAFNGDKADARKDWILRYEPIVEIGKMSRQTLTKFINNDFIQYSVANVLRSIPGFDGLKPSQRKLVYSMFEKWNIYNKSGEYSEIKVAEFSTFAAGYTSYHHDGAKLGKVIVNMAQSFVGANNLPYFCEDGQFGTRDGNGEDAAPDRYISTRPEWWIRYVYPEGDQDLLQPQVIDGEKQEPQYLLPIIPMHLINGATGVGTGFSTNIPAHSPLDIIKWLINKIDGTDLPKLIPWYRGFKGSVEVIDTRGKSKDLKDVKDAEDEKDQKKSRSKYRVVTSGVYRKIDNNTVLITELPINRSMGQYVAWMHDLQKEGKIAGFVPNVFNDQPRYVVYGFNDSNIQTLKLKASIGLGNMWLLDRYGKPQKYNTVSDILEYFYKERLTDYQLRITMLLEKIRLKIIDKGHRWKYINLIITDQIKYIRRAKADLQRELEEKHNIPGNIITKVHTGHFTQEELLSLESDIKELEAEAKELRETTPKALWRKELVTLEKAYRSHYNINESSGENFSAIIRWRDNLVSATQNVKLNITPSVAPKKLSPKLNIL